MQRLKIAMLAAAAATMLGSCARHDEAAADAAGVQSAAPVAEIAEPVAAPAAAPSAPAAGAAADASDAQTPPVAAQLQSAALSQQDAQRRFIRTASARFRVRDVYRSTWAIEELAAKFGGFVVKDAVEANVDDVDTAPIPGGRIVELATYTLRGNVQVRVPGERTQGFLRALAAQAEFLDSREFSATDAQFDLLRRQLAFARGQQAQAALGDVAAGPGKAGDRSGAIAARADAQAARDEALVAQREFEDRIAFATIDLVLYQSPQVRRSERIDVRALVREQGPGFFARLCHALAAGWCGLLDVLVGLAALWPLLLVLVLLLAGIWALRAGMRRRRARA